MTRLSQTEQYILQALVDRGQVTRSAIANDLRTRPATVVEAIHALKERNLVVEPERKGIKTGRKASPVLLNPGGARFLGLKLDRNHVVAVLLDLAGERLASVRIDGVPSSAAACFEALDRAVERLRLEYKGEWISPAGIGFADPGVTDARAGVSLKAVNLPEWENIPVVEILERRYGVPALTCPSPSARAYREWKRIDRPESGVFHMELGYGVGAGFVKNGAIYAGDTCCAMEVGHLVVAPGGSLCPCGNRGCLETIAGEGWVHKRIRSVIESGVQTSLSGAERPIPDFVSCALAGDKAACSIAIETGEYIGIALASVVSLLNPATIVFSGDLAGLGELLVSTVRRTLSLRCFPLAVKTLRIEASPFPDEETAAGAALLARQRFLLPGTGNARLFEKTA